MPYLKMKIASVYSFFFFLNKCDMKKIIINLESDNTKNENTYYILNFIAKCGLSYCSIVLFH